jgi:hypothetical protein
VEKLKYNFINPNTKDEIATYLPKIMAMALANKIEQDIINNQTKN